MDNVSKRSVNVHLRQEQLDALRALARKQGVSISELVRRSVGQLLAAAQVEGDPLWRLINLGRSGVGDLAAEHDRYLAELVRSDGTP